MATIVVVEDHPDNLKLFSALLTLKGHQVIGLSDGERLVETLTAQRPVPALVLLDVQLPGRDGYITKPINVRTFPDEIARYLA